MIHVFSATGNSLQIAEELSARTGLTMARITDTASVKDDGAVFIVCPVYYYTIPDIVKEYIARSDFHDSETIVLVINYGTTPGNASGSARRFFETHGYELDHVLGFKMPENYVPMFSPPPEEGILRMTNDVPDHISEVLAHLDDDGFTNLRPGVFDRLLTVFGHPVYDLLRRTGKFHATGECIGCGLCRDVCPRHIIEVDDGHPVWTQRRCEHCMACINNCPASAIRYGRSEHGRYVNPVTRDRIV